MTVSGTVLQVKRIWWCKINTKPIRRHSTDGAVFPHRVRVAYEAEGKAFEKTFWLSPYRTPPQVGQRVSITCPEGKPGRGKLSDETAKSAGLQ